MAPSPSSLMFQIFIVFLFLSSAFSLKVAVRKGLKISLSHVDSKGNYTKFELIQRGMTRGERRLARLSSLAVSSATIDSTDNVESPVHYGDGDFLMNIAIGTPPNSYSAVMDSGSDLIWTQCKPCVECYKQPTPIFDPKQSSSFSKLSCSSPLCKALEDPVCDSGCQYKYAYGDGSTTQGVMASETFTFDEVSIPNIGFGCGNKNKGDGFVDGAGLVGLGRGPLSLVSQLGSGEFTYCLTSFGSKSNSTLFFGPLAFMPNMSSVPQTTPLLKNPSWPSFYFLSLEGITVGDTLLDIPENTFAIKADGTGGVFIDSGVTITHLQQIGYDAVKKAFLAQVNLTVADSTNVGLDLCFSLPSDAFNVIVPKLIFHFDGADLDLPIENYMIIFENGLLCLAMGESSGASVFGNVQQQNMLITYNLEKKTLSFAAHQCDQV
ncbi:saccharopepsin [Ranunculus cassubicifolius]